MRSVVLRKRVKKLAPFERITACCDLGNTTLFRFTKGCTFKAEFTFVYGVSGALVWMFVAQKFVESRRK